MSEEFVAPWSGVPGAEEKYLEWIRENPLVGGCFRVDEVPSDFQLTAAAWGATARDVYSSNFLNPCFLGDPVYDYSFSRCRAVADQSCARGAYELARSEYLRVYYPGVVV